ncbi:MAG: type 1 fimbrial protein [Pseudomonas sp.]
MNGMLSVASVTMLFSLCTVCQAAPAVAQGEIRFTGSIVESSCTTSSRPGGWRMEGCPSLARGTGIDVQRLDPHATVRALDNASAQARLVADSGEQGRYYDQQYVLVDNLGKPITTGNYLVTLTTP